MNFSLSQCLILKFCSKTHKIHILKIEKNGFHNDFVMNKMIANNFCCLKSY